MNAQQQTRRLGRVREDVQYSLVYPVTCDPAHLGRISARTGLKISACIARLWFDLVSFGPILREDRINKIILQASADPHAPAGTLTSTEGAPFNNAQSMCARIRYIAVQTASAS
jgi:hypothetical protein